MAETSNEMMEQTTAEQQERTFTQAELDEIIKSRLAKEKAKYGDYETLQAKALKFDEMEEANKSELQKATEKAEALQKQIDAMNRDNEIRTVREKISNETGVPLHLLTGETEEECRTLAEGINAYKESIVKPQVAPLVKDGGEVHVSVESKSNGQMFGDWLNEQLTK